MVTASVLRPAATEATDEATPGAEATLEEVWAWMSSVAKDTNEGTVNINMYNVHER